MMRYETFCSLLVSLQLLLLLPIAVSAERRTALVIGNSAYEIDPLRTPVNDAINMASKLRWLGFQVTLLQDMELQAMYKAVEAFSLDLRKGGVGLFYFAGHGVQSNGENYLFPVRAHVNREQDLPHEAMPVGRILASLEEAKNDVNIVILDACRDNPFARQWHSSQRGLAVTQAPRGFLIAYVTSPGAVVSDGQDRHGLYTTHLSQAMAIPGLSLEETFKKVRAAVSEATGGMQIPWESSSLTADFYFSPQQQTEVQEDRKHREKMAASPSAQIPLAVPPPVAVPPPARIPEAQQQTEAQPLASTPTVTIQRYLTMEAPEEVIPDQEFAIQVAFTMEQLTPQARVISGPKTDKGQLNLSLPAQDSWKIDVVMSAPGFTFRDGMNTSALVLPRQGDSTPVVFYLRAKPYYWGRAKQLRGSRAKPFRGSRVKSLRGGRQVGHLYATLWYQGAYLAKVVRAVRIVAPAHVARRTGAAPSHSPSSPSTPPMGAPTQPGQPLALHLGGPPPDLTVFLLDEEGVMLLQSPHLQPSQHVFSLPKQLADWLDAQYARFAQEANRGLIKPDTAGVESLQRRERRLALLRGVGRELYQKVAPTAFKDAFWRLRDQLGTRFQSIQIYTSNPLLPWELMRPIRADGTEEQDFLGVEFRMARWHISQGGTQLERPPQTMPLQELAVIAPHYTGALFLPNQVSEIQALQEVPGYHRVPGQLALVQGLFAHVPAGIVHFSGHGVVQEKSKGIFEYAIRLEDVELDLLTWRGLASQHPQGHPFIFFNACDLGQAHRVANFVNGWAPAMLDAGASGYVGGLWPLGDKGAATFAAHFYKFLQQRLADGPVTVAEALRDKPRHNILYASASLSRLV